MAEEVVEKEESPFQLDLSEAIEDFREKYAKSVQLKKNVEDFLIALQEIAGSPSEIGSLQLEVENLKKDKEQMTQKIGELEEEIEQAKEDAEKIEEDNLVEQEDWIELFDEILARPDVNLREALIRVGEIMRDRKPIAARDILFLLL